MSGSYHIVSDNAIEVLLGCYLEIPDASLTGLETKTLGGVCTIALSVGCVGWDNEFRQSRSATYGKAHGVGHNLELQVIYIYAT